ncbi:MAG: L,D-transpeptidase family protein [Pseudomonadota bacterium]
MRILALIFLSLVALSGCSRFINYDGPEVTRIVVMKADRTMYLLSGDEVLESYEFELGFAPVGHKEVEGDGRTPEGRYFIDRRNPESAYYLSLGISYPNEEDIAYAEELGLPPGGDIFIHGTPRPFRQQDDWTWGCIAVSNREMRQIYAMVTTGTVIDIYP